MSNERRILSVLIVIHLLALGLAALPPEDALNQFVATRSPSPSSPADRAFTALAELARRSESALFAAARPLRAISRPYLDAGLRQTWNMFAHPGRTDQYLRVDHYVRRGHAMLVLRELVYPADDERSVKIRHRFSDKAVFNAIFRFGRSLETADIPAAQAPATALAPVARDSIRRVRAERMDASDVHVRTELWYGKAWVPPPGDVVPVAMQEARARVLDAYRDETFLPVFRPEPVSSPGAIVSEADLEWTLFYVQDAM
jgi:hypothetical protein